MEYEDLSLDPEVIKFLEEQKDFVVDRVSQEGGNCDIFFGEHKIFERRIALKVYYGNDQSTSHYEPKTLAKLDHPNILKVRDAKRIGKYHSYFMTDEIDGGDLEKYYKAGKLDLKKAISVTTGILLGLSELHKDKVQIVHRDIKPKNILINEADGNALIADFGSIKHFGKEEKIAGSRTTTLYMPPEVIKGENYTTQSDIYQVGVTMYQILGGFFPDTYAEWLSEKEQKKLRSISGAYEQSLYVDSIIFKQALKGKLFRLESLPDYINPKLVAIIKKAIHVNPRLRYANAGEFLKDIYQATTRLTNWEEKEGVLYATKSDNVQYRIVSCKKGYSLEKLGNYGWRRNGDFTENKRVLIKNIA